MNTMPRWCGSALLSLTVATVVVAQTPATDVRLGLWEMTSSMSMGGDMPAVDTSRMTPQQKAQVEAMMQNMIGAPRVTKTCMTKEKLDKAAFMVADDPGTTCTQTVTKTSRTSIDATVVCVGTRPMTGQMHIDATSPTSFTGTITATTGGGGREQAPTRGRGRGTTMNIALSGTWLNAACGDVK